MVLNHKIYKSPDLVFDYLTDMQKFVSVHPVINSMEHLGENKYIVFETLKFGFISCSFKYPAAIYSNNDNKQVVMSATVMNISKIRMVFSIKEDNGYSIVEEAIHFHPVSAIKPIMQRIFKKQHNQLFKNIGNIID